MLEDWSAWGVVAGRELLSSCSWAIEVAALRAWFEHGWNKKYETDFCIFPVRSALGFSKACHALK
jgi:hypothetical protein